MSNSSNSGCLFTGLLFSANAAVIIGSGLLIWDWIEPENFLRMLFFLIVWGLLSRGGCFIVSSIIIGIASWLD